MTFFEIIGFIVIFYYIVQVILWIILDCDIMLYYKTQFGKPINTLKDKVVWITGASSGIGRELAKQLSKNGVRVVLSGRNIQELEAAKLECMNISKGQLKSNDILVLPFDMLNLDFHRGAFNRVISHFGSFHILVNNAGRSQRAEWNKIDINVDRELFELDVFSVINLSRIAVTYFDKYNIDGQLAITSSTAGLFGAPNSASYTGAKHSLHGYFEALRTEKNNINVNLYCPGPTFSNFLQESFIETQGAKYNQRVSGTDRRMTTERCAYLYAVALANNIHLSWSGIFPINLILYVGLYYPNIKKLLMTMGVTRLLGKVRDSR
ncbi:dehydrogenase/reductase SDR family member 7-like [Chironomus tepperi]|uniref:dehydrogenase/reductase SDR family member 7-like n=1 Tax=Chironomus tepperi TaxID=113505 RepID=UPI00391F0F24